MAPYGSKSGRLPAESEAVMAEVVDSMGAEAYKRRVKGESVREIADSYQVTPSTIYYAISKQMERDATEMPPEERDTILRLENDRLDALQKAHWDAAMFGDPKSTDAVLKVMAMRQKINQMESVDPTQGTQVLVVAGNEDDYVKSLRGRVEGQAS